MLSNQEKEYLSANKIATKTVNGKEYFISCFEFKEDFAEYYNFEQNANALKKQEPYKNFELLLKLRKSSTEEIFYNRRIVTARNGFDKTLGREESCFPASLVYVCFKKEGNNIVPVGSSTVILSGKDFSSVQSFVKEAERGNKLGNFLMGESLKDMYKKNSEASILNLVATSDGGKALINKFYGIEAEYGEEYNLKLKDTRYITGYTKNQNMEDSRLSVENLKPQNSTDNKELSENSMLSSLPENKQKNPPFLQKLKNVFSCKSVDVAPYEEQKGGRGGGI